MIYILEAHIERVVVPSEAVSGQTVCVCVCVCV